MVLKEKICTFLKNDNRSGKLELGENECKELFSLMFPKNEQKYSRLEVYFESVFVKGNSGKITYFDEKKFNPRKEFQGDCGEIKTLNYTLENKDICVPLPLPVSSLSIDFLWENFIDCLKQKIFLIDFSPTYSLFSKEKVISYKTYKKKEGFSQVSIEEPLIINKEGYEILSSNSKVGKGNYWRELSRDIEYSPILLPVKGAYLISIDFKNAFRIVRKNSLSISKKAEGASVSYSSDFVCCNKDYIKFIKLDEQSFLDNDN